MRGAHLRTVALERVEQWYLERLMATAPAQRQNPIVEQMIHWSRRADEKPTDERVKQIQGVPQEPTARGHEKRVSGRSIPLVDGEMSVDAKETERFLEHVYVVDPVYCRALVLWSRHGKLHDVVAGLGKSKPTAYRMLEAGAAILMSCMVRTHGYHE